MSTNEKAVELSIEETDDLRRTLGLKPLNIPTKSNTTASKSKQQTEEDSKIPVTFDFDAGEGVKSSSSKNKDVIELSIDETNALRLKLGLKPLDVTTTNDDDDDANTKKKFIHAPARNMTKEKEIKERVLDAKMRREVDMGIQRFQKKQEEDSTTNDKEDLKSWVERMRKSEEEEDAKLHESNKEGGKKLKLKRIKKGMKKTASTTSGKEEDVVEQSSLAVPDKAEEGMVLTLKDEEILDCEEDEEGNKKNNHKLKINENTSELEHSSWHDEKKAKAYIKGTRELSGVGSGGWVDVNEEEERLQQQPGKEQSQPDTTLQIASDYMTHEEEMKDVSNVVYKKSQMKAQKKLLKQFKKRDKLKKNTFKKRLRTASKDEDEEDKEELVKDLKIQKVEGEEVNEDQNEMKRRKDKYASAMEAATLRSQNAFSNGTSKQMNLTPMNESSQQSQGEGEGEAQDNDIAAMIKAKRLAKLKKLQNKSLTKKKESSADAIAEAISKTAEVAEVSSKKLEEEGGITFELDPTKEFTRALRAATSTNDDDNTPIDPTISVAATTDTPDNNKNKEQEPIITNSDSAPNEDKMEEEEEDIHQLAAQMEVDNETKMHENEEEEPIFGTTPSVGRGLSSVLSLFQTTGDINTSQNPHASKEKLRGRAKDERHYDDYSNLDLNTTVQINSNQKKDMQFKERQVKLDYRDEHGRLLTRKEAFRQMCYQFHGYGSFNKSKEKRLKLMQREQAMESSAGSDGGKGNSTTLGVLTTMQEVTGKAFVVHKT